MYRNNNSTQKFQKYPGCHACTYNKMHINSVNNFKRSTPKKHPGAMMRMFIDPVSL